MLNFLAGVIIGALLMLSPKIFKWVSRQVGGGEKKFENVKDHFDFKP